MAADSLIRWCLALLWWLMLCYPGFLQAPKALLGLVLLVASFHAPRRIEAPALVIVAFSSSYFLLSSIYGLTLGNPGAVRVLSVNFVWPLFFLVIMGVVMTPELLRTILRTTCLATAYVSGIGLSAVALGGSTPLGILYPDLVAVQYPVIGWAMSFVGLHMLVFSVPMIFTAALVGEGLDLARRERLLLLLVAGAATATLLLAGRRGALLSTLIGVLVAAAAVAWMRPGGRSPKLMLAVGGLVVVSAAVTGTSSRIVTAVRDAATFLVAVPGNESDIVRWEQAQGLVEGFTTSAFIGQGAGAGLPEIVRDEAMPWAYELTYHSILFQYGLVGLIAYLALPTLYLLKIMARGRHDRMLASWGAVVIAAVAGIVVASASNPYLFKLDTVWLLSLPLGVWSAIRYRDPAAVSVRRASSAPHWTPREAVVGDER